MKHVHDTDIPMWDGKTHDPDVSLDARKEIECRIQNMMHGATEDCKEHETIFGSEL